MTPDSVERSVVVHGRSATAFEVFTAQLNTWWPTSHSRSGVSDMTCLLEPGSGGRIDERTARGVEYQWGEIVRWEPPQRVAFHWHLGSGSQHPSHVGIQFTEFDDGRTRVDVVHRGPELLGELWERTSAWYAGSWEVVLTAYLTASPTA